MSLNENQKTNIGLLYKKGIPLRKIQEITHSSQSTIERIIKSAKIKKRGEHCLRISRARLKNFPDDYRSGKFKIKELMLKYGIKSEQTIYRLLDEFNIKRKRLPLHKIKQL